MGNKQRTFRVLKGSGSVGLLLAGMLALAGFGGSTNAQPSARSASSGHKARTIYLLWPNSVDPGWPQYYEPSVVNALRATMPGVKLVQLSADNSQSKQLAQVEAAIASHASGVVLAPAVPPEAGASLAALKAAHIPTIAYLIDPDGGPVYGYVWVNFKQLGQQWGGYIGQHLATSSAPLRLVIANGDPTFVVYTQFQNAFQPYLKSWEQSGKVQVVCNFDTTNWQPAVAQTGMEQCLTQTGGKIDAVLAMNDSVSDGVWAALREHQLAGKVTIYGGYDGALTVVQRILIGNQVGTMHIDGRAAGNAVARLMQAALAGRSAQSTGLINARFDNHYTPGGVPTVQPRQIFLTRANVQEVITDHIYTKKDVCTGIAATSSFCTGH